MTDHLVTEEIYETACREFDASKCACMREGCTDLHHSVRFAVAKVAPLIHTAGFRAGVTRCAEIAEDFPWDTSARLIATKIRALLSSQPNERNET
jgi:hypothetical protein